MLNRRKFLGLSSLGLAAAGLPGRANAAGSADKVASGPIDKTPTSLLDHAPAAVYHYPEFNLAKIPFSYVGSYHTISKKTDADYSRLAIDTVRRSAIPFKWADTWPQNLLEITLFVGDTELPFKTIAKPWCLELQASEGASATMLFADADTLVIETRQCSAAFFTCRTPSWGYHNVPDRYVIYDHAPDHYYYFQTADRKPLTVDAQQAVHATQNSTIFLRLVTEERHFELPGSAVTDLLAARRTEIDAWMKKAPSALPAHLAAVQTAWYLFWDLQVAPRGNYTRRSVLSSKRAMNMLWSWDICFNALALVHADHRLAWDQLFAILDQQRPNGLLPDAVSDLRNEFGFNKPPVWGWTIRKLLSATPEEARHNYIEEVYPKIAKFTHWWFENRVLGDAGVCAYMHGNDSGWDNATIFDEHCPVESPDLTAFLILQTETLADLVGILNKPDEAMEWTRISNDQLTRFKKYFIGEKGFVYRVLTPRGPEVRESTCLLTRMPLLLGQRLDPAVTATVIAGLSVGNVFLTPTGIASEALTSPKYEPNGYWRGPVWAPSTYLIVDGLLACGERTLATTIATRFCNTVAASAEFDENYNAVTGKGQYDSGLTWTASDFLLLSRWLATEEA